MKRSSIKMFALIVISLTLYLAASQTSFIGADEKLNTAIGDYASAVGVGEKQFLFNSDNGELQLFLFAIGGAIAGFWIGYNWRDLFPKRRGDI